MHRHGSGQRHHRSSDRRAHSLELVELQELEEASAEPAGDAEPAHASKVHDVLDFQGDDPLSLMLHDENARLIGRALKRLPPMQRLCIVLSFYDNLPASRIAELLGISPERVSDLRRKGLRLLRKYLCRYQ